MRFSLTITISCASAPFFLFFSLPLDLALLFFENHSLCTEQVHVYVQHFNTCSQFSLLIRVFVHHCCRIRINSRVVKLNCILLLSVSKYEGEQVLHASANNTFN